MGVLILGLEVFGLEVQFFAVAARAGLLTEAATWVFQFNVFSAVGEISSSILGGTPGYLFEDVSIPFNFVSILPLS